MQYQVNRRTFLQAGAAIGMFAFPARVSLAGQPPTEGDLKSAARKAYAVLQSHLAEQLQKSTRQLDNGLTLWLPSVTGYVGLWPDDFLYPLIADPSLVNKQNLTRIAAFLTDSIVELRCVPDRVEPDGLPILRPGATESAGMGSKMPPHLPAAWVRLLSYFESYGVEIPRKDAWARVIKRSVDQVAFSCGLVYIDPQSPSVGFGFHDSIRITGLELMSSLMLHRGLQRAAQIFHGVVDRETIEHWSRLSNGVVDNSHRLYDAKIGGYVGGTRGGRQFNVWGNGLAYWFSSDEIKRGIVDVYRQKQTDIFHLGCTRQIVESNGWNPGNGMGIGYQNGGFWATGTGWVLPALADQAPEVAIHLLDELTENLSKFHFAEWIDANGQPQGALGFLASLAMPMIALRSILESRSFVEYF